MKTKREHIAFRLRLKRGAALLVMLLLTAALPAAAAQVSPVKKGVFRIGESDRYATSLAVAEAVAEQTGRERFDAVVLASGKNFPDALAGSFLARVRQAPILMVGDDPAGTVDYVKAHLTPNGTVYILGGPEAVSSAVEEALTGLQVKRLGGASRYETNIEILKEAGVTSREMLVCTGTGFADSLSASAVDKPILLVDGTAADLTAQQKEYLASLSGGTFYLLGGPAAVCEALETALRQYGSVERIAGEDRYATAAAVAERFFTAPETVLLAYGENFPDGLCGGPLAMSMNAPILLAKNEALTAARDYVRTCGAANGTVLGGTALIGDAAVRDVFALAETVPVRSWSATKNHTIRYVLNGGKNSAANPESYTAGQTLALQAPTKVNYDFDGWYKESSFKTKVEQITPEMDEDLTLYAKWTLTALNIRGETTDNMIWSWWYYPQVVSQTDSGEALYWGYATDEGYCGVARYDKATGKTEKTALKRSTAVDDHNGLALTLMEDGRIMCVYSGGHNVDREVHVRISDAPYDISSFSTDTVLLSSGLTCYGQILQQAGNYYIFYRVNNQKWAYRSSADGINWSGETVLVTATMQYYCRFMPTTQDGLIRVCMYSNPTSADPRIRMGFLDLSDGTLYNADGVTPLGKKNVSYENFSVILSPEEGMTQRMLDVAITAPQQPRLLVASFRSNRTDRDSVYRLYDAGTLTDVCRGGEPLMNPKYQLGAAFLGADRIVAIRSEGGADSVQLYACENGGVTLEDTFYSEEIGADWIRNARPIVDVNGKAFLWHRGYYKQTVYTDFDTDARIWYLDSGAQGFLDPADASRVKPENVAAVKEYAAAVYAANEKTDYTKAVYTWDPVKRGSNWIYFTGLMHEAFLTADFDRYHSNVKTFYDQHISNDGTIKGYLKGELDAALLGAPMVTLLQSDALTAEEKALYNKGVSYIYSELEKQTVYPQAANLMLHSQNADGTPRIAWKRWNICLDGVYMSQMFLIRLADAIDSGDACVTDSSGNTVTSEKLWADICGRLTFVMENMWNEETGLLDHGYYVAGNTTNRNSWSRGIGWYAMVLMEACEKCPDEQMQAELTAYFRQLMDGLLKYQDVSTFLWYNVPNGREELYYDKQTDTGVQRNYNIPETSGSSMFAYCLLKGYKCGFLAQEHRTAGLRAFNSLVETKLTEDGLVDILNSSSVVSESYRYMVSGYVTDDGKGAGPFILSACYVE